MEAREALMQSLTLAMKAAPEEGEILPNPFRRLTQMGALFRRGQVSLVAAASGGGKSAFASHVAVHSSPKIPTLYFSADSDKTTVGVRVAAGLLGKSLREVEDHLHRDDFYLWETISSGTDHIWWCWDASPTLKDIESEVLAYAYTTGEWPSLIVVDNLINIDPDGEVVGHAQKDGVVHWFQQLANLTNAHVMILHHVTGEWEDGLLPIPKSGLLDKVAKRPRLVLTLYKSGGNTLGVCVVKNSSGQAAADGSFGCDLGWMPERSWFSG
jgi:hypothetical protein